MRNQFGNRVRGRTWRSPLRLPFKSREEMWWTLGAWAVAAFFIAIGMGIIHAPSP